MNNHAPIYLTREDYAKLRLLLKLAPRSKPNGAYQKLHAELDRAAIVDVSALPSQSVTMGSRVTFEDRATGEIEQYTLVFPEQADVDQNRLSVLAPIGTALLGYSEGDEVHWDTPGGRRHILIREVTQPAAVADPVLAGAQFG
ncbi:nucleoside diphosphate kinase regulator [Horticoccus luteus]|uniref:Nucleoside diphosphate kinase regulator n=1 Tax=Horticoccus luteus TaxID=2862869 RepID=A0A8F9TUG7_9BACT|nr:nucleoside diphosphate kinase regulator [Horticoccus luteus]QYM78003.1 nucleoside diphosphate kinase regulator [Horticoccus luteus]